MIQTFEIRSIVSAAAVSFIFAFVAPLAAFAATTPLLGAATTYGILSSTYTNTSAGTTVHGDVGFTTGPAITPLGVHTNYGSGFPYPAAGTDQGSALSALASQACSFTFPAGAVNLSTDTAHGPIGVYVGGVYCSTGAMDIGGPLTLSGSGTFIFRPIGAFTSTANAVVTLNGASACDVFWTPSAATTLAANTTFMGTIIGNAGITVGANTTWTGRALAFGGTVTSDTDTITVPNCSAPAPVPAPLIASSTPPIVIASSTPVVPPIVVATSAPATVFSPPVSTFTPAVIIPQVQNTTVPAPSVTASVPLFPDTGLPPEGKSTTWNFFALLSILGVVTLARVLKIKRII